MSREFIKFYGKRKRQDLPNLPSPEELIAEYIEYLKYNEAHPVLVDKVFNTSEGLVHEDVRKKRLQTEFSFCMFADIHYDWFLEMAYHAQYKRVIEYIRAAIRNDSIEGATSQELDPMIVSRHLGLADTRKEVKEIELGQKAATLLASISKAVLSGSDSKAKRLSEGAIDIEHEEVE